MSDNINDSSGIQTPLPKFNPVKDNTYKASVTFGYSVLVDAPDEYAAQSKAAEMFDYWIQNQKFPKLDPKFVQIVRVFDDDN